MNRTPPVVVEPYDRRWPKRFETERSRVRSVLSPWLVGPIEHIGSTAVPGLAAKPVIDMMAPVRDLASSAPAIEALAAASYCYFPYRADAMHWFCKPSPLERTHHLHLVPLHSPLWRERLAFRDRLRTDAATRHAYEELKKTLAARHGDDREAYTEGKTGFIRSVLDSIGSLAGGPP